VPEVDTAERGGVLNLPGTGKPGRVTWWRIG
jgi:hypothetical protein